MPGQANCLYHEESNQEDFLVLHGECIAIIEEQERPLRQWDFVHCPPGTRHVFVGAGDGPCAILMIGARDPDDRIEYPVSEVAARHNASAAETTNTGREAYRDFPPESHDERFVWPLGSSGERQPRLGREAGSRPRGGFRRTCPVLGSCGYHQSRTASCSSGLRPHQDRTLRRNRRAPTQPQLTFVASPARRRPAPG